jgi:16S rRNA processing protein RimM
MSTHEVVVGRIGRPHGIHGELSVELRTDEPERRFATGVRLATQTPRGAAPHGPDRPATLTVGSTRWHQSRLLVRFEEIADRTAAERVRGLVLVAVVTTDGEPVGEVAQVIHGAGQDLLAVLAPDGRELLVPFVAQLVPVVDVPGGRVEVADRPGLLTPIADEA